MTFNGFISYSHAADGRLAPAVHRGLHRLAKPWHRRRALWIFRDQTGLSVTPALWTSIQNALDGSEYFVLMASPEAARSQWVNKEIEHWIATKSAEKILPVVTDGEWEWDPDDHDFTPESTAVPAALRGVFTEEPLYLDLRWARGSEHLSLQHSRFRDAIAQLAAPMHGVSKDELEGEDVRQHRKARRLRSGAVATLVVLAMIAGLTGHSAVRNAEKARDAAAEALRQSQVAEVQRTSAERSAEEAVRQQELAAQQQSLAQEQQARAADASDAAQLAEEKAQNQQKIADRAAAEARRQQKLADAAARRTKEQQRLAREAYDRAQRAEEEAERAEKEAQRLKKEAERLAKDAAEQQRLAREAAQEAKRQQAKAEQQQQIAVSRRLMNQAKTAVGTDPEVALMLGAAAQKLLPDTETRSELSGVVTSTSYAGAIKQVTRAAYGPDGVLATLGTDGTVSLWNVANPTVPVQMGRITERDGIEGTPEFSPDGRLLGVLGAQGKAALWDVTDRSHPVRLAQVPDSGWIQAIAFSGDGVTFASGDSAGATTLWDLTDRTRPQRLTTMTTWAPYPAEDLEFSADGRTLVANKGRFVPIWDLTDRRKPVSIPNQLNFNVSSMAFDPRRPVLAVGDLTGAVMFYEVPPEGKYGLRRIAAPVATTVQPPPPLPTDDEDEVDGGSGPPPPIEDDEPGVVGDAFTSIRSLSGLVHSVEFSRSGRYLSAGDGAGTAMVWSMGDGDFRQLATVRAAGRIDSVTVNETTRTLVTTDSSATATLWNITPQAAPDSLSSVDVGGGTARATAFRPDGKTLLAAGSGGTARSWTVTDPAQPQPAGDLTIHNGAVGAVAISPDGRTVAAAGAEDGRLTLTDRTRPSRPLTIDAPSDDIGAMVFSPDGRTLAAVTVASRLLLWDLTDRDRPRLLVAKAGGRSLGRAVAFSPDGQTLATGGDDRALALWNVADRAAPVVLATLDGHRNHVGALAFSSDGRTLASGSHDTTAMLWDVRNRAKPYRFATMTGHSGKVTAVAFSPDGRTLATGDEHATVILWDTASPAGPIRLAAAGPGISGTAAGLSFRRDGSTLAVTGQAATTDDATVTLWSYRKLNTLRSDPARQACAVTGRGLNAEEWARYIPEYTYRKSCPK